MKTEPETPEFESAAERLADSLLSEHARLGSGNDDELIGNILAATVSKTAITPSHPEFGVRNWMIMGTSVAALVAVLLLVLSNFRLQDHRRSSDTFQFVVKMTGPLSSDQAVAQETGIRPGPQAAGSGRYDGKVKPVYQLDSTVAAIEIKDGNFLLISRFNPSVNEFPAHQSLVNAVTISADESVHKGTEMSYSGKVVMTHNQFTLTADELEVLLDKESGNLIARGRSELKFASGKIKKLDPKVEELVLNGETYSIRALRYERDVSPVLESTL